MPIEVLIRERGFSHASSEQFDVLIRATGFDTDLERTSHPLVAQLRDSGMLSADPLGLGINASPRFEALDGNGAPVRGLYALGPLLRAQLWEITAVPELRVAARALAKQLLASPASRPSSAESRLATVQMQVAWQAATPWIQLRRDDGGEQMDPGFRRDDGAPALDVAVRRPAFAGAAVEHACRCRARRRPGSTSCCARRS